MIRAPHQHSALLPDNKSLGPITTVAQDVWKKSWTSKQCAFLPFAHTCRSHFVAGELNNALHDFQGTLLKLLPSDPCPYRNKKYKDNREYGRVGDSVSKQDTLDKEDY